MNFGVDDWCLSKNASSNLSALFTNAFPRLSTTPPYRDATPTPCTPAKPRARMWLLPGAPVIQRNSTMKLQFVLPTVPPSCAPIFHDCGCPPCRSSVSFLHQTIWLDPVGVLSLPENIVGMCEIESSFRGIANHLTRSLQSLIPLNPRAVDQANVPLQHSLAEPVSVDPVSFGSSCR
jgi:hypothetical protein